MPFCPNPECPHLKRTGRAAEFLGEVMICSDCGTRLAENEITVEKEKEPPLSDFKKRLIYTLGMLALWRILAHIAPPGINFEALDRFLGERGGQFVILNFFGFSRISVLALGLMPYITASVAIEILALFLKPLKSWREAGYNGRLKLRRTAFLATLILALVQGYGIAKGLAGIPGEDLVYNRGVGYCLFFALTLTTGTFITLWVAEQITRKGIGHGISVILFTSSAGGLLAHLFKFIDLTHKNFLSKSAFEYLFLAAGISAILVVIIVFMEKSNKRINVKYEDGMESYIPLKLTTAGIVPTDWAGYLLMLPVTVLSFINIGAFQKLAKYLSPGEFSYSIIYAIAIIFFYYLFTSFFYRPKDMIDSLNHKGGFLIVPDTKDAEDYIDHVLEIMAFAGAIYLCLLFFLPEILIRLGFPIYIGGAGLILTVAIILDLFEEFRLRRKSHGLTKIMEFHDVQKAGLFRGILERRGISCLLQGYYHRSLLYFFGPYIEISVLVPQDRSNEASELFDRYFA